MICFALVFFLLCTCVISLFAQYPYIISQEESNALAHMYGTQEYGQSFTVPTAGCISQIQISLRPLAYPVNVTLNVYPEEGYSSPLFVQNYPVTAEGLITLDFEFPLLVSAGLFTFSITPDERTFISMSTVNPDSEGSMYLWDGNSSPENDLYFIITIIEPVTSVNDPSAVPDAFILAQNYPNPFNPNTTISFKIPGRARVTLNVFDLMGHEVARLVDGIREAGTSTVEWNASRVPTGVYIYKLQSEGCVKIRKCVLMK